MDEGVFTAGVVDNIDHNPSSTTSSDSFHGTSISLIQHRQTDSDGNASSISVIDRTVKGRTCIARLPISYTDVLPVAQTTKELFLLPPCHAHLKLTIHEDQANHKTEYEWLEHCRHAVGEQVKTPKDPVSWSAFHAAQQPEVDKPVANIGRMPLLLENAHTIAMIKHAMKVVASAVNHLTPITAMDQPLFALAKEVQWNWPDTHGEQEFVVMMGGLHIETAALKVLGDWLDGSGWTNVLSASGMVS